MQHERSAQHVSPWGALASHGPCAGLPQRAHVSSGLFAYPYSYSYTYAVRGRFTVLSFGDPMLACQDRSNRS